MSATAAESLPAVLLVSNFLSGWDGRRTYAEDLAAQLEAAGIRVRRSSRLAFKPARLADMMLAAAGGRGAYELAVIDVYSGQAFFWAEAAARAARLAGKRIVLPLRGGRLPEFAARHERRVAALLAAADAVIAPSPYLEEAFRRFRPDIRVLPNAIDLRRYPCRIREQARPRLVWLRSFHRIYNPVMAIEVLARVRARHRDAALTMYGPDKDGTLAVCRQRASELGVADAVCFAGVVPKDQVGRALAEADIFLNTTNIDNTPVSVIEAMACGLCVVSTDAGGVPFLVRDGREALLVRAGDADGMAQAVLRLLEEAPLCRRLSAAARGKAQEFGWDSILPRWMDLFGSLCAAREVRR